MKKVLAYILIVCILFETTSIYALTKEENVYAKLKSTGEIDNVLISQHLSNFTGKSITDKSILSNIKNLNGKEKFKQSENNLIWETTGNDIYYQGSYKNDLPISVSVKYYLNGKEHDINDILGKKGKIKIVMTYENSLFENIDINGKKEKIYTPYVILTTSILNNANNKNITVTNGKIINNGVSSIVMAISSPGLYESLNISKLQNINKVEISYDTDNFELNPIYSVATSDLFNSFNTDIFGEINNLYNNISLLQSNMDIIVDGSKKLNDGTSQMDDGITLLNNKIQELTSKYKYYRNKDSNELKEELIKIVSNNMNLITPLLEEEITEETKKIIHENKEELENAVVNYTMQNTKEVLDEEITKVINKLDFKNILEKIINSNLINLLENDPDIINVTNALKENIKNDLNSIIINCLDELDTNITNNEEYINNIAEKYGVTYEQAVGIIGEVQSDSLNQIKESIQEKIQINLNNQDYLDNIINEYINTLNSKLSDALNRETTISEYGMELKEKIKEAIYKDLENEDIYINLDVKEYISSLVNKIIDNTSHDLSSKYTEEYSNKVVKNVIEKQFSDENVDSKLRELLDTYEDDINKKISDLDDKIDTLSSSLNKLNDGSKQISDGMNTLSQGLEKYNSEGINKISKLVNGDVKSIQKRLDALISLSKENKIVDNIPDDAQGSSRIIFMIDSISKEKDTKKTTKKEEKKSTFWDKVKGLFN